MGNEETMKMLMGENLRIMVGGQVVGMAKEAKFSIVPTEQSLWFSSRVTARSA